MIDQTTFEGCVARAALAPTIHNTQPARWLRDGAALSLFCDTDVGLPVSDPEGRGAALSCGAVLEAMVLALSAQGIGAEVTLTGHDTSPKQGLVAVAHLTLTDGAEDGLHRQLERRFTWRGAFADEAPALFGWTRRDTRFVMDHDGRAWLATRNDAASHEQLQIRGVRQELLDWMRLTPRHPRAGLDGMDRRALRLAAKAARALPLAFGPAWPLLRMLGRTRGLAQEAQATMTAPLIGLFHRDREEPAVESGRAYLRLCLEAASLGLAGWPMAALTDHDGARADIVAHFGLLPERRLIQAIRFGVPTGDAPPRARRPLGEVLRPMPRR
ncbi:hypothetical protein [Thalassorhabdomicrobium marinisediminis]|uniref:Nitroreductase n=1 Tax=Thalassorhabdomicrobium marinisediminis TaxID=2170577 RepID=A0A2T7FT92_9RHOB|nr:hypothetical protein [Thalassorhabdomicrobium marinisediminis]PVA05388.1 hypothetical protein DC363_15345 [Thalassorhabdomicrobium marinisediminis]